jgi:hypothetical protein
MGFLSKLFPPDPPHVPKWYAMSRKRYEEYDKRHLEECGSVIKKNIYTISRNQSFVIYFNGSKEIDRGYITDISNMDFEEVTDKEAIKRLDKIYADFKKKTEQEYRKHMLAED